MAIERETDITDLAPRPTGALGETASTAAAAQAQASIQARYIMALQRPRDFDGVRVSLLKECKRPRFAEVARYRKPIGGGHVEGPSIRFVEAALRCMTNVLADTAVIFDDDRKRIIRVTVTDLEANITYPADVSVDKTVERSDGRGRQILAQRTNKTGKPVYIVAATEDELLNKQAALVSKAMRTCGLRLIPGDLIDEAMEQVLVTQQKEDAQDPDAARKRIVDAYAAIGVLPPALAEYLGHEMATCSPAELVELRAIGTAIKNGETTWQVAMETRRAERAPAPAEGDAAKTGAAGLGVKK